MSFAHSIAVDWGTSNLRAFALDASGALLAEAASDQGMGRLTPDGYEPVLLDLIGPWLDPGRVTPVAVCGMAGARQGWTEAAYRAVPCAPVGGPFARPPVQSPLIDVFIVPGLSQAEPADVMRGEETQIAGVLAARPGFSGIVCLPGTHSKWAMVKGGRVERFSTFMTGELFALLSHESVLRHGFAGAGKETDWPAFEAATRETAANPQLFAARLFSLRAESLLTGLSADVAQSRLSGQLVGMELAAARDYWLEGAVTIIGNGGLSQLYRRALTLFGVEAETVSGEATVLAGLAQVFESIGKEQA